MDNSGERSKRRRLGDAADKTKPLADLEVDSKADSVKLETVAEIALSVTIHGYVKAGVPMADEEKNIVHQASLLSSAITFYIDKAIQEHKPPTVEQRHKLEVSIRRYTKAIIEAARQQPDKQDNEE